MFCWKREIVKIPVYLLDGGVFKRDVYLCRSGYPRCVVYVEGCAGCENVYGWGGSKKGRVEKS